ncbi:hypothetical protein CHO01_21950 [Cellulomonas hominis]|uniref:TraD/TraG TraM recognition site domain-containing protein n=1 Tax=Cellulomonas hominis TaxID=156981 RepID=A0A511FCU5_9CELL|nr:type IV secretory system conjugative DNA transfer family protein [Cellulomonas hominis]MBB5474680.1 hypothetical protein [Cellulomonas hominis]NKY05840.1 type IV secretory system conjugative DNA transfer family protein [Cellulomonas hominis]GEL47079.1 hypothetical protein CHO01_21950 [Cellulomonas hominis]
MKQQATSTFRLTPAGGIEANPTTFTSRASAFASASGGLGGARLLVVRDEQEVASYVQFAGAATPAVQTAAEHLAAAVAANAQLMQSPPDLGVARAIATLRVARGSATGRDTLNGVDLTEAARTLARSMDPGQWVAVTLRAPSKRETRRHRGWLEDRMGAKNPTHHSMASDAVMVTIRVGAGSQREAAQLARQVRSTMPGFDQDTRAQVEHTARGALGWTGGGLAAGAGVSFGLPLAQVADVTGLGWPAVGGLLGSVLAGVGALIAADVLPTRARRVHAAARAGALPGPASSPLLWRKAADRRDDDGNSRHVAAGYPLDRSVFKVGPQVVAGLVAPHAGAISGSARTATRATPPALTRRIGPLIGTGADGNPVHLSADDLHYGVVATGRAGSGKSQLIRSLFAWSLLERVRPCAMPGFPGARHGLIAFESKGEGAVAYEKWGAALGHAPLLVDVADPQTPGIDIFAVPGTLEDRAAFAANAMRYVFGDDAVGNQAFPAMVRVFSGAMVMTDELATRAGVRPGGSPFYYAHLLVGGQGDKVAEAIWGVINEEATRLESAGAPDRDLSAARDQLAGLFSGPTPAQRRSVVGSSENKFYQLRMSEQFWTPARPKRTWDEILTGHQVVVINTGVSRSGVIVEDTASAQVSGMLTYALRHAVLRLCTGWQEQGRYTSIFADELSLLAGTSPEVIVWLRNQGRSYGARSAFATQYMDQLHPEVRAAVTTFATMFTFRQDGFIAEDAARDAASDGSTWSGADIVGLPVFSAVLRTDVHQARVPACTVTVANFEADRAGFAASQGYGGASAPAVSAW